MALHIVHFIDTQHKKCWGLIQEDQITSFLHDFESTQEIIQYGILKLAKLAMESKEKYLLDEIELLSPITNPSQIYYVRVQITASICLIQASILILNHLICFLPNPWHQCMDQQDGLKSQTMLIY